MKCFVRRRKQSAHLGWGILEPEYLFIWVSQSQYLISLWYPTNAYLAYYEKEKSLCRKQNSSFYEREKQAMLLRLELRQKSPILDNIEKHNLTLGVKLRWKWKNNGSLCPKKKKKTHFTQGVKMRYCSYNTVLMLVHWFFFYLLACFSNRRISSSALLGTSQLHGAWLGVVAGPLEGSRLLTIGKT